MLNSEKYKVIDYEFGTSRGVNSYGYNICTLVVNGEKTKCRTVGVGYSQTGTVLGEWLESNYRERLEKLTANYGTGDTGGGLYGLTFYSKDGKRAKTFEQGVNTVGVYGGCGLSAMYRIAEAIGLDVIYLGQVVLLIDKTVK